MSKKEKNPKKSKEEKEELQKTMILDIKEENNDTEKNIKEKPIKNPKPKNKKKIILLIILSLVIGITAYFVILDIINSSYLPPSNANYKSYNYDGFAVSCSVKGKNSNEIVEKGDIITCYINYDLYSKDEYNVKELYYNLEYGSNLKYLGFEEKGENHAYHMKNNYKIVFDKAENRSSDFSKVHKFRVLKKGDSDSTYVKMTNIVFKNSNNKYYKAIEAVQKFNFSGNINYIYKKNDNIEVLNYEDVSKTDYLQGYYRCQNKDCKYLNNEGDYVFFEDDLLVTYNYVEDSKITFEKELLGYQYYEIIKNEEEVYGVLFDDETGKSGYYSLGSNKIVLKPIYDYINAEKETKILYFSKDDKYGIYDLKSNKLALKAEYDDIYCYEYADDLCLVEKNNKTNLYDRSIGKTLLNEKDYDDIECFENFQFMCILTKDSKKKLYAPYISEIDSTKLYNHIIIDKYAKGDAVYTLFDDYQVITYMYLNGIEPVIYSTPSTYSTKYFYEGGDCGDAHYSVDVNGNIISLVGMCTNNPESTGVDKVLFTKEDNYKISYDDINMYLDEYEDELYIDIHLTGSNGSSIDKDFVYDIKTKKLSEIKEDFN